MLLADTCLWQTQSDSLYNHYPLINGNLQPTPENLARETTLLRLDVAEFYLLYSTLWSVKLAVLIFFWRLFGDRQQSPWLKSWWWVTTGFTVATWAVCLGTIPYGYLPKPFPYILGN